MNMIQYLKWNVQDERQLLNWASGLGDNFLWFHSEIHIFAIRSLLPLLIHIEWVLLRWTWASAAVNIISHKKIIISYILQSLEAFLQNVLYDPNNQ